MSSSRPPAHGTGARPGPGGRRGGIRWVPLLFGVVFPLVELAGIIAVGQRIGAGWTFLALVAGVALGVSVIAAQGRKAITSLRGAATGQAGTQGTDGKAAGAARELGDGALLVLAGVLLMLPGFIGDVVALSLFLPPVRSLARKVLGGIFATRFVAMTPPGFGPGMPRAPGSPGSRGPAGSPGDDVVEGTVVEGFVVEDPEDPDHPGRYRP